MEKRDHLSKGSEMKSRYLIALILAFGILLAISCSDGDLPTGPFNRVPDFPSNPSPADSATGVPRNVTLSWTCDDPDGDSLTYDVYLGTDSRPPLVNSGLTTATYRPEILDFDTTYYWRIVAWDDEAYGTGGPIWSFSTLSDIVIQFPDPGLEEQVRGVIGKPTGDIFVSDVDALTSFGAGTEFISDLRGMEYMTALVDLMLPDNFISDLSPLSSLTALRDLWLFSNQISDLSPLSDLTALSGLYLGANHVSDLSPLSDLPRLMGLYLFGNDVDDLSPLSALTQLEVLGLSQNDVSDLSPLSSLHTLAVLSLCGNDVSDLSPLSGLTALTMLTLEGNNISDLSGLSDLTELSVLWLDYNNISDISRLSGLVALRDLWLQSNQISDILPLVNNLGLGEGDFVNLRDNPLSDTSINTYIPELQARRVRVYY